MMKRHLNYSLQSLNTFHVNACAASYIRFEDKLELIDFCRQYPFGQRPWLILGGGSNLLFVDDFDGFVFHPCLKGIKVIGSDGDAVRVKVMAGESWDDFVAFSVGKGWSGVENLSLIPGSVGASVVQNIGAYGIEVKTAVHSVEAVSLTDGKPVTFFPANCGFGYRTSNFKTIWSGRFIITAVTFQLSRQPNFKLDYPGVRTAVKGLGDVNLETIRQAITTIRKNKLPDPDEVGNAGSFFKNPVVDAAAADRLLDQFPDIPRYHHPGKRFKLAAGWMIEQCGFKGKRFGGAAVHDRQALVLVNCGNATGSEILALSEKVRKAVYDRFGICLEREVQIVPDTKTIENGA